MFRIVYDYDEQTKCYMIGSYTLCILQASNNLTVARALITSSTFMAFIGTVSIFIGVVVTVLTYEDYKERSTRFLCGPLVVSGGAIMICKAFIQEYSTGSQDDEDLGRGRLRRSLYRRRPNRRGSIRNDDRPPPYSVSSICYPVVSPTSTTLVLSPTIITTADIDINIDLPKYNEIEVLPQPPKYKDYTLKDDIDRNGDMNDHDKV